MIRSFLYVPASSPRFISKAHERGADAIILDLEDSVAPAEKLRARASLAQSVPAVGRNNSKVFVRINSQPDAMLDDAEAACRAGVYGLFVPKVRLVENLVQLDQHLSRVESSIGPGRRTALVPMIEDPSAVLDARALAGASSRTLGMIVGSEDLSTAMGAQPTPEALRFPKLLVHLAAKAAGVLSFGLLRSVADYRDLPGVKIAAKEARELGFDGATCVHPDVVAILNEAFSPSGEEIDRAVRMIKAYEDSLAAGHGACVFEGKMIDVPVVERARALIANWSTKTF
jgi:citrate lyase subunit beta/citryl-CoA lyase